MSRFKKIQAGFTLIELLLGMGIVVLVIVGGIALFGVAGDRNKTNGLVRDFSTLSSAVHNVYGNAPSYVGISDAIIVNGGGISTSMHNGIDLVMSYGDVTVAAAGAANKQWTATYEASKIPSQVCGNFVSVLLGSVRSITVGGAAVTDVSSASTACNASNPAGAIVITSD